MALPMWTTSSSSSPSTDLTVGKVKRGRNREEKASEQRCKARGISSYSEGKVCSIDLIIFAWSLWLTRQSWLRAQSRAGPKPASQRFWWLPSWLPAVRFPPLPSGPVQNTLDDGWAAWQQRWNSPPHSRLEQNHNWWIKIMFSCLFYEFRQR